MKKYQKYNKNKKNLYVNDIMNIQVIDYLKLNACRSIQPRGDRTQKKNKKTF